MKFKRDSCALITIDMQNDFVLPGSPAEIPGSVKVIPNILKLLSHFRALRAMIVHVVRFYLPDGSNVDLCRREKIKKGASIVRPGTKGSDLVKDLKPSDSVPLDSEALLKGSIQSIGSQEFAMYKPRWGAFYGTPLEKFFRENRIESLVFCGCNFPNCPRASIYEASERDFEVALISDAVSAIYDKGIKELQNISVIVQPAARIKRLVS